MFVCGFQRQLDREKGGRSDVDGGGGFRSHELDTVDFGAVKLDAQWMRNGTESNGDPIGQTVKEVC